MQTLRSTEKARMSRIQQHDKFTVLLPEVGETLSQDKEWCVVQWDDTERKFRFHDYHEFYKVPGLYECVFYDVLKCNSPQTVCSSLKREMEQGPIDLCDLSVLDVGAGNGMVGEELARLGVESIVGIDIIEEASEATERDRPDVYKEYHVVDLTDIPRSTRYELQKEDFNCLITVAALGFGDIPPLAFAEAFNMVSTPGWIAFNIKDKFMDKEDSSGFSRLIHRMDDSGILDVRQCDLYRHRIAIDGTPLYYYAVVGIKEGDIPMEWVQ